MKKGEKKVVAELKAKVEKIEKLTKDQKATLAMHKPTWWMEIYVWALVKRVMIGQWVEGIRTWMVPIGWGTPQLMEARKRIRTSLRKGTPVPVFRDPAVVNHIKGISRKDLERLAIVQATHLRTYLDFYGKRLVNHIAIDGHEMTRTGIMLQRARGVKGPEDIGKGRKKLFGWFRK